MWAQKGESDHAHCSGATFFDGLTLPHQPSFIHYQIKTPEAAAERFRRAVDAIIAHNNVQTDPLHFWFINAREVRNLVGGKNELVQAYLETRRAEIDAHHNQYGLTPRANKKNMEIKDEVKVQ